MTLRIAVGAMISILGLSILGSACSSADPGEEGMSGQASAPNGDAGASQVHLVPEAPESLTVSPLPPPAPPAPPPNPPPAPANGCIYYCPGAQIGQVCLSWVWGWTLVTDNCANGACPANAGATQLQSVVGPYYVGICPAAAAAAAN